MKFAQAVAAVVLVVVAGCCGANGRVSTNPQWSGYATSGRSLTSVSTTSDVPAVRYDDPIANASF